MSFLTKEISLPRLRSPKGGTPRARPADRRPSRSLLPRRRSSAVTGLEIGATQIIAAQAHLTGGHIVADRVIARPLPPGIVRDGIVLNGGRLAAELRELFATEELAKRVRVGLATPRTVLRVIDVPPLDEADVAAVLPMLAQDTMPMPLDGAVLDHQSVGVVDTPDGRRLRLIVVAAERAGVETLADAVELAGLSPVGIDLSVFAAIRAVAGADAMPNPVLFAQLGDLVHIGVAQAGVCRFTRQAPQGLALILTRLADQQDLTFDAAQALLATAADDATAPGDPAELRQVGGLLAQIAIELASELRATAEFYGTQFGATVSEGIVTGPLTTLRGFVDALADASGMSLRVGEATLADGAETDVDVRVSPVAVGLAIDRVTA